MTTEHPGNSQLETGCGSRYELLPLRQNAIASDENLIYPRQNFEALASLGLLGLLVPKEWGGLPIFCYRHYMVDKAVWPEEARKHLQIERRVG